MTIKTLVAIIVAVCLFEMFPGPIGLLIAFLVLTKHTQNFVLKPLAKYWWARGISPKKYMERKLKNIREVIWFFAIILDLEIVFFLELFAIGISFKIINNLKNKMEIPTSVFSKDDYTIYDEYWKENPPLMKDAFYGYDPNEYKEDEEEYDYGEQVSILGTKKEIKQEPKHEVKIEVKRETKPEVKVDVKKEIKYEVQKEEIVKKAKSVFEKEIEIPKVEIPKVNMDLFDKPLEDIKTDFSIKTKPIETGSRFDFDKPIGDIATSTNTSSIMTSKIEVNDDEITCEKCGNVMSKNKIACPKCGELVRYKRG